jgi:hypothetical protein
MLKKRRSLKLVGLAVVAVMAFSAIAANAASARSWNVNGSALTGSAGVTCSGGPFTLASEVGGLAIQLHATGVECISSVITAPNKDSGSLKFTGVTVEKPSTKCTVPGGSLTTNALKTELLEVSGKTHGYDLFTPASGSEFLTVTIASCAVAGEYPVEGSIAGEGEVWGTEQVEQPLNFSSAIDGVTGHSLTFAEEAASLTGTAKNKLTSGLKFGAL